MATAHPRRIPGRWRDGYAQFDTTRSEIGELLFRLKYRADETVVPEIVDAVSSFFRAWNPKVEMIIPVTPSRQRAVQPVLVLGQAIAQHLKLGFAPGAVQRVREVPELKDVHDFDERLRLLQGSHQVDRNVEILGAIPALSDSRRKMTAEVVDAVRDRFGLRILTAIPRHVALAATPRYAKSVLDYAGKTAAADAFRALAKEVSLNHVAS